MFTLCVANREYTEWTFQAEQSQAEQSQAEQSQAEQEQLNIALSPLVHKLFHGDKINASGKLIYSPYREKTVICGLLLTSEKTYGRSGTKFLYKCVPDAEHLPCFLVAYEEKNIGFTKTRKNKYITFRIKEWKEKHPLGVLVETFGDVDDSYIAYKMASKELNASLKTLNAMSLRALREKTLEPIPLYCENLAIEDRRTWPILSIDPAGCQDIDDAVGIRQLPNEQTMLSIYIANVPLMLEYLQLWPYLTDRVATIYLPDSKIPMLPVALSENACSLLENTDRLAFVLDITLNKYQALQGLKCKSTIIRVEKNYAYDAPELLNRAMYKQILTTVRELNKEAAYVDKIINSHDVVEYCMLRMNHECAKILEAKKGGIFRSAQKKAINVEVLQPELKRILESSAGDYCTYADRKPHELLGLERYIHITSPIRRIVDIVNMFELLEDTMRWTADAKAFKAKWQGQIATINTKAKAIRKLQNEMQLLHTYTQWPDRTYLGFIFEKAGAKSAAGLYKYKVYIAETKMLTTVKSHKDVSNYSTVYFSAHLFLDEAKMTKKIRLQLL